MIASVPAVEVSHHAHARSMWRPDGKRDTFRLPHFREVRAKLFIDLFVPSFAEEMQIDFT